MTSVRISEEHDATEDGVSPVVEGLRAFNNRHMPAGARSPLILLLRDDAGAVVGGLIADTRWHWLLVGILWVDDAHRGLGLGSALLCRAEEIAIGRGCQRAALDTAEFQARGFYERAGYRVFGSLDDYPPGSRTYYLEKSLIPPRSKEGHPP